MLTFGANLNKVVMIFLVLFKNLMQVPLLDFAASILADNIDVALSADIIYTIVILGMEVATVYTVSIFSQDFRFETENKLSFKSPRFRINQLWFVGLMSLTYQLSIKNQRDEIQIANLIVCGIYAIYLLWDEYSHENFEF